ncbi:helix-turn-helix domain-containing protein [Actinoplanes sp. CA-142083]|uniref:helix-turn-helix domain-containing protein n=1 Tax=Actinoplanes sp. CA-142083 TaxID=3239903 RepID=UPI003D93426B
MTEELSFAALLRRLRTAADLTLEQLAEASGVTDRAISDMERGVSRGPRVRTVEAITDGLGLSGDDRAALFAAARAGRASAAPPVPGGLPLPRRVLDFTGRDAELGRVARWAAGASEETAPVVVISGPPGVGKTSFAVQAAQAWPVEEQVFVDLRGLDTRPLSPSAVLGKLIRAVSPEQRAVPRDVDEAAALWHTLTRGRRLVVVLDNAISESQVRPALPPHGPASVLVTSRRALSGLEGVRRLRLDALPEADAVRLLSVILDDAGGAPESLRRLAGICVNIPLALRIAGNRLLSRPGWTLDDLISRLAAEEQRLTALAAGDLQVEAAFRLSYQQLTDVARRLFRRLSLVPGPSTGAGLASVLAGEPMPVTEQALDELVELCLLQQRPDGRLEFHDLLRLYAGAELDREETVAQRRDVIRRRDGWLLDTVVLAGRFFEPGFGAPPAGATPANAPPANAPATEAEAGAWLRQEADNWLPALQRAARDGDDQRVVDVAESLHWFSDSWGIWPHWLDVFTLSTRAAERLGDSLLATHLGYLAWVHIICMEEPEVATGHARRALAAARRAGDRKQEGWSNYYVGWALSRQGRWAEVLEYARPAVTCFRETVDKEGLPNGLMLVAIAVKGTGPADASIPLFEEAIVAVTDPATAPPPHIALFAESVARAFLAGIEFDAERWPTALRRLDESIAVAERLEQPNEPLLTAVSHRALVHARLGDLELARADLATVHKMYDEMGVRAPRTQLLRDRMTEVQHLLDEG